jgi:hypothetical protein
MENLINYHNVIFAIATYKVLCKRYIFSCLLGIIRINSIKTVKEKLFQTEEFFDSTFGNGFMGLSRNYASENLTLFFKLLSSFLLPAIRIYKTLIYITI